MTRWRKPFDGQVVGTSFVWRDYFHGLAEDLAEGTEPGSVAPVEETHISLPYLPTSTPEWKLAFSTPVRNEDGEVIGVLARTVVLHELLANLAEYDSAKRGVTGEGDAADAATRYARLIALYELESGELLDHPWLTGERAPSKEEKAAIRLPTEERIALQAALDAGRKSFRTDAHADPTANLQDGAAFAGAWIAAFAPVGGTDWIVVVQEPRSDALRLMESFRAALAKVGGVVVAGTALTLAGLLFWFSRDRTAA
ncbi:MAG: hypothetical protein AAF907_15915 [Planctomycetota bacterium]